MRLRFENRATYLSQRVRVDLVPSLPYRFLSGTAFACESGSAPSITDILPNPPVVTMENQTVQDSGKSGARTILLVEDFDDTRLMMRMWLSKNGYRVVEAETGEEAISAAQRELPDLILMDMMMPGLNGLDATRRIREYQALRRTPIVAVSAYGADEYRAIAIEAGCDEYVSTPFEPSELAGLIRSLIAARETSKPDAFQANH